MIVLGLLKTLYTPTVLGARPPAPGEGAGEVDEVVDEAVEGRS